MFAKVRSSPEATSRGPLFALGAVWLTWFILFLVQALVAPLHEGRNENVALLIVSIHVILVFFILLSLQAASLGVLVVIGFAARVAAMIIDIYGSFDLPITASPDDIRFFAAGVTISQDLSLAGSTYGGFYSTFLGYLFYLVGPSRLTAQYLNVLFGVSAIMFLVVALRQLQVDPKTTRLLVFAAGVMPVPVFFSAQLLRESVIQMLIMGSFCSFLVVLFSRRLVHAFVTASLVLCASVFHAGVIGVLVGYCLVLALVDVRDGELRFSSRRLLPTLVLSALFLMPLIAYSDLFLSKFVAVESQSQLLASSNQRAGGAAYLTELETGSIGQLVLSSPLRTLYFVLSPVPWDWRHSSDVFAFAMDSFFYLAALGSVFLVRQRDRNRKILVWVILIVLGVCTLIFGLGVSNSGTAMRHRSKVVMLFFVLAALMLDKASIFAGRVAENRSRRSEVAAECSTGFLEQR